jgi:hypothetical protein
VTERGADIFVYVVLLLVDAFLLSQAFIGLFWAWQAAAASLFLFFVMAWLTWRFWRWRFRPPKRQPLS